MKRSAVILAVLFGILGVAGCSSGAVKALDDPCKVNGDALVVDDAISKLEADLKTQQGSASAADKLAARNRSGEPDAIEKSLTSLKKQKASCTTTTTEDKSKRSAPSSTSSSTTAAAVTTTTAVSQSAIDKIVMDVMEAFPGYDPSKGDLKIGEGNVDYKLAVKNAKAAGAAAFIENGVMPESREQFVTFINSDAQGATRTRADFLAILKDAGLDPVVELPLMKEKDRFIPIQVMEPGEVVGIKYHDKAEDKVFVDTTPREAKKGDIYFAFITSKGTYVKGSLIRMFCMNGMPGKITKLTPTTSTTGKLTPIDEPPPALKNKVGIPAGVPGTPGSQTRPDVDNRTEVTRVDRGNVDEPGGNNITVDPPRQPVTGPVNPTTTSLSPITCKSGEVMMAGKCQTPPPTTYSAGQGQAPATVPTTTASTTTTTTRPGTPSTTSITSTSLVRTSPSTTIGSD